MIESIFDIDRTIVTGAESVEHFDVEIGFIMPLSWLGSGAYTGFDGVSPISR